MGYKLTLLCVAMSTAAMAQVAPVEQQATTDQQPQQQGLFSRFRSHNQSTRQQLRNNATEIAQPANSPQGYAPGVTFPQQQAQPQQPQFQQPPYQQPQYQQPVQPGYPGYPPQQVPYNLQPGGQAQTQQPGAQPTATPASASRSGSGTSSRQSGSSSSDSNTGARSGSSASRTSSGSSSSGSSSSSNRSSSASGSGTRSSSSSSSEKPASSSSAAKTGNDEKKSSAKSSSSSALEKIVKKVESEKSDDNAATEPAKKTEEEIAAEKARATALKAADEATTVVAGFLKQANDGYYSKATEELAPAIQKYFDSEISAVNGTQKTVLDELTANGTITMVTYINTTVRGEGAVVEAELGYEDGHTARRSFDLVKIKDDWKIVLPVTERATVSVAPVASNAAVEQSSAPDPGAIAVTQPRASLAVAPPPTAEQAAAQSPLVLAPGTDAGATTGTQQ